METVLSDICCWRMGIVELDVPEQWSWDLVVEFLQFIKQTNKETHTHSKTEEIVSFTPLNRAEEFFSEIIQMLNRSLLTYSHSLYLCGKLWDKEHLIMIRWAETSRCYDKHIKIRILPLTWEPNIVFPSDDQREQLMDIHNKKSQLGW